MTYKEALIWTEGSLIMGRVAPEQESYTYMETVKKALEKQIPKKPYKDNDNGIYSKDYCPTCHRSLFPNDHHCRCGQAIDFSEESK